jgi:F420-non-reducing hydrogenase small subunit
MPQPRTRLPEGDLFIPAFYPAAKSLDQVTRVDYTIPGCPPEPHQIWAVLQAVVEILLHGAEPPPAGAILGAGEVALCQECPLEKSEKKIQRFYRPYEIIPEPGQCLLEQGLVCMGPATRSGCGALCPQVGMGCRGCYGPLEGVEDQGVRMLSALASVIDAGIPGEKEDEIERQIRTAVDTLADPAGTFYRFSMAHSFLNRKRANGHHTSEGGG